MSGLLNLSRNLGLITGASAMGAVFAVASGAGSSDPNAVATGMRAAFGVATALILVALSLWSLAVARRAPEVPGH